MDHPSSPSVAGSRWRDDGAPHEKGSPLDTPAIRLLGDPVLRTPTVPVTSFDLDLSRLIERMTNVMAAADGVGLAANQIGVGLRVFVYDIGGGPHGHLVNPTLDVAPGATMVEDLEGCLSVPDQHHPCIRASIATVRGYDLRGRQVEVVGDGLLARCFQHEVDHLDGVLYIDRLSRRDRSRALEAFAAAGGDTSG